MPTTILSLELEGLKQLADLLLGAAYSDGQFDGFEAGEISDILDEVADGELPVEVSKHLSGFNPDSFSVEDACEAMDLSTEEERQAVVALVTRVTEADSLHDLGETAYLRRVINALGGDASEYEAHLFDVVVIKPPPTPKG